VLRPTDVLRTPDPPRPAGLASRSLVGLRRSDAGPSPRGLRRSELVSPPAEYQRPEPEPAGPRLATEPAPEPRADCAEPPLREPPRAACPGLASRPTRAPEPVAPLSPAALRPGARPLATRSGGFWSEPDSPSPADSPRARLEPARPEPGRPAPLLPAGRRSAERPPALPATSNLHQSQLRPGQPSSYPAPTLRRCGLCPHSRSKPAFVSRAHFGRPLSPADCLSRDYLSVPAAIFRIVAPFLRPASRLRRTPRITRAPARQKTLRAITLR